MTRTLFTFAALLSMGIILGCGKPADDKKPAPEKHAEHDHPSEGPHGGHLIELGAEEYHAELVHDDATKTVTVYLLDSKATQPVGIAETELTLNLVVDGKPQQVKLAAAPQPGDTEGNASRFSVVDEKVLEALDAPKTTGRLNVTIAGKSYTGEIAHEAHDHKH
jgi:hypothetical protein